MSDIGKEYGAALFMLACEAGEKKTYANALKTVWDAFSKNPEYPVFLASPSVSQSERIKAIETAFSACIPEHVLSFLMLLCEKGRMQCFESAMLEYNALLDASEHIFNAKVTSAAPLTEAEKEKLKTKLETVYHGKVHMTYDVDASLLGGLIVDVDGKIMDGSLRYRLRDVKEVMSQ